MKKIYKNNKGHINKLLNIIVPIVLIILIILTTNQYLQKKEPIDNLENLYSLENYNYFEEENGLFSFYYQNTYEVKKNQNIYFLQHLINKSTPFQIFKEEKNIKYNKESFICNKKICHTKPNTQNNPTITKLKTHQLPVYDSNYNLVYKSPNYLLKKIIFFKNKGIPIDEKKFNKYDFLSRAEAVYWVVKLKYPNLDEEKYASNCFSDITTESLFSNHICFAKSSGIVKGINNQFLPDSSINLWGILKLLFYTFKIHDFKINPEYLDQKLFEEILPIHIAYPTISKSYYSGIFHQLNNDTIWSNRNIYKSEAINIIYNFILWKNKKVIKNYQTQSNTSNSELKDQKETIEEPPQNYIYFTDQSQKLNFEISDNKFKHENLIKFQLVPEENKLHIFTHHFGDIYNYLYTISEVNPREIKNIKVNYRPQRKKGYIQIIDINEKTIVLKSKVEKTEYRKLKNSHLKNLSEKVINKLHQINLLPNLIKEPSLENIPVFRIFLSEQNLENIFINRTSNQRYPAHLEIEYPNTQNLEAAIVIKTRGNANKGYIKSDYTIEAFDDLHDNIFFKDDEFLNYNSEIKLRGFINEPSKIHEKLFYNAFNQLGWNAPKTFESLVEVNGVPMGLYQITEPIKKPFFKSREIKTKNYFYAKNSGSKYPSNLTYFNNDDLVLSQYKIKGDPKKLLSLIKYISDPKNTSLDFINTENIFDYAALVYLSNAYDSLKHNYYVYFDEEAQKWNIIPWDSDASFSKILNLNLNNLMNWGRQERNGKNNLIYYVFKNLSNEELQIHYTNFINKLHNQVHLKTLIETLFNTKKEYYIYDNKLWYGKFLERSNKYTNTLEEIINLSNALNALRNIK